MTKKENNFEKNDLNGCCGVVVGVVVVRPNAMMSVEEPGGGGDGADNLLQVSESALDVDSSDVDMDEDMEMSSGMLSFASPTKRDSLDEGYDPNETIKVIVYEGNTIEIRPSTLGITDDDDDDEVEEYRPPEEGVTTDDDDVHVDSRAMLLNDDIVSTDVQLSTGHQTGAEEEESELGSQDTYFYPSKFGLMRDYETEEGESEKPIAIKPISIADPEPKVFEPSPRKKMTLSIPGPPRYLSRSQTLDIPKIEVTTDDEGEGATEPKKFRRGAKNRVTFPIPGPVRYMRRDEKPDVVKVEIHKEPEGDDDDVQVLKIEESSGATENGETGKVKFEKSDTIDSNGKSRLARQTRVTFNIPEPVQYMEREEIRHKRVQLKSEDVSDGEISDRDDVSGAKTSDSEVEEATERKRYRPVSARVRVTSPLPDPVHYLSRRESQHSSICDASQVSDDNLQEQRHDDNPPPQISDAPQNVTLREPYRIPDPVKYLTREEKLSRLKQIASTGSADSDTQVFNEIMRAVQASATSIDSDDVYNEIVKAFHAPNHSFDSNDVYNEIMAALKHDEDAMLVVRGDSVDLAAPEILSFQDFISSSTYSTVATSGAKNPSSPSPTDNVDKIVDDKIDGHESSSKETTENEEGLKTRDSVDIPENPVPSPVHYPSSKVTFDESYTPIMVDGKIRRGSAKSLSKLRQHCSSRAHPCDCNDVCRQIFFSLKTLSPFCIISLFQNLNINLGNEWLG